MIDSRVLSEKLLNYIYNVVLSEKQTIFTLKDKFHRDFKLVCLIILLSCSMGLIVSNLTSYFITGFMLSSNSSNPRTHHHTDASLDKLLPYNSIRNNIIKRNIFNRNGNIPFEDTPEGSANYIVKNFDKVPCSLTEKLPVDLLGIIYTGNPLTNLVTLKDPKISIADVYKEGQEIIDNENFSLYKVTSSVSALFRHANKKICVSLNPQNYNMDPSSSINIGSNENVTLDLSFVTEQLGPGFSTILNSARLVPQIAEGKMSGFRIFSIAKGSLFDKVQLLNGDIIVNINGINLEDASQGFKIYEAFHDENNISLQIERNGIVSSKRITVQ